MRHMCAQSKVNSVKMRELSHYVVDALRVYHSYARAVENLSPLRGPENVFEVETVADVHQVLSR